MEAPCMPAGLLSDDELAEVALAADPETPVAADAVCLWALDRTDEEGQLLPSWYMPAPVGGRPLLRGWRRRVAIAIIVSFVAINAYGLCSTYGEVVLA